ncbi:MAG: glycosyltransferase family 39 protein [Acidobacteria bacterium]|nr:glycosyltransferase family 39 protein [Acidobacteriota bacterium]
MDPRRAVRWLVLLTVGLGTIHLWMAGALELAPDEAYYWTWSKHLALAYPDHPPLVAWLVAAGTALGGDTEVGVRLWFVVLGTGLIPLSFLLARRSGARPGIALLVAAAVGTSLLGSAGALLATPETPFVFGWTLAMLGLIGLSSRERPFLDGGLLAAGTAVAVASKLTGILLPAIVALWLFWARERVWRKRWTLLFAVLLGLVAAVPVFLAGLGSGGSTAFQLRHGLWAPELGVADRLANLGAFLGGQIGLLSPALAVAVIAFLARPLAATPASWPLWLSAIVPWALFGFASLLARPEANWPACAHVGALAGAALLLQHARDSGRRWSRGRWIAVALGLQVLVSLLVHVHLLRPFLPLGTGSSAPFTGPSDPAARLHGWKELVGALQRQAEPIVPDVLSPDDPIPAVLRFYGLRPRWPAEWQGRSRHVEWEWWSIELVGRRPGEGPEEAGAWSDSCAQVSVDAATVDPGLVHPSAPVRIRRLRCADPPGRIR